jgi:hypothetical protein
MPTSAASNVFRGAAIISRKTYEAVAEASDCELSVAAVTVVSYGRVKRQLKGDTLARMREIIAAGSDPMLVHWV